MSKFSCKLVYDLKKLKLKCAFNLSISSLDFLLYFFRPQNLTKILLPIKVSGGSKYIFYDILKKRAFHIILMIDLLVQNFKNHESLKLYFSLFVL